MTKCVIVGDLHIHDYTDYNLEGLNWRLNQFIKLSTRIIEIAKDKGCSIVIYAGDLIHRPILTSKTAHVVDTFFKMQYESGLKIYYILGQHDLQTKSNNQNYNDSIVPVLLNHYASYMDRKIITIDDRKVAFSNWRPQQDFSFIPDKVDVLIGHLTLSEKFGQAYDDSKYTIGFFGDIHKRKSIGNSHTTNVPIPHYISDNQRGSVIVLDFKTLNWERVDTETKDIKFLKIMYEDNPLYNPLHPYTMVVDKPKIVVEDEIKILNGLDLEDIINQSVNELGLTELHTKISTQISRTFVPIDLNFILENIQIHNFKSISNFSYNFVSGITAVTGENGSGKSTLMRAIEFIFQPPRSVTNLIMKFEKEMSVTLSLSYQNKRHTISRGYKNKSSWVKYEVNGEEIQGNSYSEINQKISDNLPFVKFFNLLYRSQGAPYLLSDYSYEDRIKLISEILGLGLIQEHCQIIKTKISDTTNINKNLKLEISNLLAIIENTKVQLDNKKDSYENNSIESIQEQINKNNARKETCKKLIQDLRLKDTVLSQISNCKTIISELQGSYDESSETVDIKQIDSKITSLQNVINNYNSEISVCNGKLQEPQFELNTLKSRLLSEETQLSELKDFCPTCKKPLDNDEVKDNLKTTILNLKKSISENTENFEKLEKSIREEIKEIQDKISKEQEEVDKLKNVKVNYQNNLSIGTKIVSAKVRINSLQEELEKFPDSLETYSISELEQEMNTIESLNLKLVYILSELTNIQEQEENLKILLNKYDEINKSVIDNDLLLEKYLKYQSLFLSDGLIIQSIFKKVSEIMSDGDFIVRTIKYLKSGESRIDFDVDLKVSELVIPYAELSGGQKILVDIFFLNRLFQLGTRAGVLILDESLKELSEDKLEEAAKILKSSKINTILLSTHVQSFNFYDFKVNSVLVNNVSQYTLEGN